LLHCEPLSRAESDATPTFHCGAYFTGFIAGRHLHDDDDTQAEIEAIVDTRTPGLRESVAIRAPRPIAMPLKPRVAGTTLRANLRRVIPGDRVWNLFAAMCSSNAHAALWSSDAWDRQAWGEADCVDARTDRRERFRRQIYVGETGAMRFESRCDLAIDRRASALSDRCCRVRWFVTRRRDDGTFLMIV